MIWLSEQEMRNAVTYNDMMDSIEKAFEQYHSGNFSMPDRYTAAYDGKTMLYMPCFAAGVIGTKMLAEFPDNPKKGLPYLDGLMILNDLATGAPLAVMNGSVLTALRTGAVGGVAMRHFSSPESSRVGVIGCGVQGLHQAIYACSARNIREISLLDPYIKDWKVFTDKLRQAVGNEVELRICSDASELLLESDIVITTTQAKQPVLPNDASLLKGKCYVAIGSWRPDMRELPDEMWCAADHVFTELPFAMEESGDFCQPLNNGILREDQISYMADYLADKKAGKEIHLGKTICYKSVGMGIFDVMAAKTIYEKAMEQNLGQRLDR